MVQLVGRYHPDIVSKICILDIGDGLGKCSAGLRFFAWFYQTWNMRCFLSPWFIGTPMLRLFGKSMFKVAPVFEEEKKLGYNILVSSCCYMYFYLQWRMYTRNLRDISVSNIPNVPFMFINANKNPIPFYSSRFKRTLEDRADGEFLDWKCHHWIPIAKANALSDVLIEWLATYRSG